MSLLKKNRGVRMPMQKPKPPKVGCPFCFEWLPPPQTRHDLYNPEGTECGQCECGAYFVIDATGRSGGQALLDAQVLICDGDLERALAIDCEKELEIKTRNLREVTTRKGRVIHGHAYLQPKVWAVRRRSSS